MKISRIISAALSLTLLSGIAASSYDHSNVYGITARAEDTIAENRFSFGDVNNDGQIDAMDATAVLSYYSLVSTGQKGDFDKYQKLAADVNSDRSIDATDATSILAYYAYVSTTVDNVKSFDDFVDSGSEEDSQLLGRLQADTTGIYINTEEKVRFTVKVDSDTPLPDKSLALYDDSAKLVSYMSDDGKNGDETANDGVYSAQMVLSSADTKNVDYYAAVDNEKSNATQICFYRELTDDDCKGFNKIAHDLAERTFEEACDYVRNSDEIQTYEIDDEQERISYQTIYGFASIWISPDEVVNSNVLGVGANALTDSEMRATRQADGTIFSLEKNYLAAVNKLRNSHFIPASDKEHKVAVLEAMQTECDVLPRTWLGHIGKMIAYAMNKDSSESEDESEIINSNIWYLDSEQMNTYEGLKHLQGYETVLFAAHGTRVAERIFISTATKIPSLTAINIIQGNMLEVGIESAITGNDTILHISEDYFSKALYLLPCCDDLRSRNGLSDFIKYYEVCITPEFFKNHYDAGSLDGSIWALSTCNGLHNDSFADVLMEKGAETVLGFSNTVYTDYSYNTLFETLVNSMIFSEDTVGKGVSEAKRIFGAIDIRAMDPDYDRDPDSDDGERHDSEDETGVITKLRICGNQDYRYLKKTDSEFEMPGTLCISFAPLDTGTSSDERMIDVLKKLHKDLDGSDNAYYTAYSGDVGICLGRRFFLHESQYGQYDSFDEILDCARSMDNVFSLVHEKAYNEKFPFAGVTHYFDPRKDPNRKHAQDNDDELIEVLKSEYQKDTFNILNPLIISGNYYDYWYGGNTTSIITIIKDDYYYDNHGYHNSNDLYDENYNGNYFRNNEKANELRIPFIEYGPLRNEDGSFQMQTGAHVHNRVHYVIDLRDRFDMDLAKMCLDSGGKYIQYSEDSKELDWLIELINTRRINTTTR